VFVLSKKCFYYFFNFEGTTTWLKKFMKWEAWVQRHFWGIGLAATVVCFGRDLFFGTGGKKKIKNS
jgi:hypothetical protein